MRKNLSAKYHSDQYFFVSILKSETGDTGKGWVSFSQTIPAGK